MSAHNQQQKQHPNGFLEYNLGTILSLIAMVVTLGITYGKLQESMDIVRTNQERMITYQQELQKEYTNMSIRLAVLENSMSKGKR